MAKKLKGISHYFDGKKPEEVRGSELVLREAFLRSSRDVLDNFGVDKYSVERIWGMVELLEQYALAQEEIDNARN